MTLDTLEALVRSGAQFVMIGGVAARAHGSARITEDLDICYDTAPKTLDALAALINGWNPRLRIKGGGGPEFSLDERALRELAAITLETDRGPIDLLREVKGVGDYQACRAESETARVGSLEFQVLALPALIRAKRAADRQKDRETLIELEALAELIEQRSAPAVSPEQLLPKPPARHEDTLESDLALFSHLRRLHFERVRQAGDAARARELDALLSALPPLDEVAHRIVAAVRDPQRLAGLTPEQLATVQAARAQIRRTH